MLLLLYYMSKENQVKFVHTAKIVFLACLLVSLSFLYEPILRKNFTFAFTAFDRTPNSEEIKLPESPNSEIEKIKAHPRPEKSHAPEPSTLFLLLSGISGFVVRFARRRFEEFKRLADIVLSILGLFMLSPIIALAATLIKINSSGPVVYRQNRMGKGGRIFRIYKLRTMYQDAEKHSGAVWARENDPRITSVGRMLRKTHMDEILQLLNVLRGEMSIVGPRPERPELVRDLKTVICDYEKRLQVKPGITGMAQVWHKYDETIQDVKKKIKYDLLYIRKMCLLADLRILANTAVVVLTGRGAR